MKKIEKIVWVYPWDLKDEGIEEVLDRLEENGITGLNVAMFYHSGRFLLPHNPKRKVYFPEPGALYFNPDSNWFDSSKIKPPISQFADNQFWKELRKETRKRNMTLSSWLLGFHNSNMGRTYPELSVVNAFGDMVEVAIDPAHLDVKAFFLNLVADLARNFDFDRLLLESFEYMPFRHDYHHEVIGIPTTPTIEFFLSLSFSDATRARAKEAGIDIELVQKFVKDFCEEHFKNPHEGKYLTWEELEKALDGEMKKYLDLRKKITTDFISNLYKEIKSANPDLIVSAVDFSPLFGMGANGTALENGIDLREWAEFIDEIHPTFYFSESEIFKNKVTEYSDVLSLIEKDKRPRVIPALRAITPQIETEQDIKTQIQLLKPIQQGFSFYNYGFMSYQHLSWIKNVFEKSSS